MSEETQLVSLAELSVMLRISEGKISAQVDAGEFPRPVTLGGRKFWSRSRVNRHIADAERAAQEAGPMAAIKIPARSAIHAPTKAYTNQVDAYAAGLAFRATLFNDLNAAACLRQYGISASLTSTNNTEGGFLAPDVVEGALSVIRDRRSVFARNANPFPMNADICRVPRLLADVSSQWATEGQEITAGDMSVGAMQMKAKKLASLSKISSEVDEDAVTALGDIVTMSMGLSQAAKIDSAAFVGDGTSSYGGCVGILNALHANAINEAASGNTTAATLDLADFENTAALLPTFETATPKWYMNASVFFAAASRVLSGSFYVSVGEDGITRPVLLGYPVEFVPSMPSASTAAAGDVLSVLGDLRLGCTYGTRNGARTAYSPGRYFESDQIGIRSVQRVSLICHETGEDAATRPIVGLKLAAA